MSISHFVVTWSCVLAFAMAIQASADAQRGNASPVSFTRDLMPLLLTSCAPCHTARSQGDFSLATYDVLLKGGPTAKAVIPGDSKNSLLIKKLRGPLEPGLGDQMPWNGNPLSDPEISLIERWIDEGAKQDSGEYPLERVSFSMPDVQLDPREWDINVACMPTVRAALRVTAYDESGRVLATTDEYSSGPNEWKWWRPDASQELDLTKHRNSAGDKMRTMRLELSMRFRAGLNPSGTVFVGAPSDLFEEMVTPATFKAIRAIPTSARVPPNQEAVFEYWLKLDSTVSVRIWQNDDKSYRIVRRTNERDLKHGLNQYRWDFANDSGRPVNSGDYVLRFQGIPTRASEVYQRRDIVILYRIER